MKKIIYVFTLMIALVFVACDNPFKKLEDSIDAVTAAANLASNVDELQTLFTNNPDPSTLSTADMNTIQSTLEDIKTVLSNDATAGIIQQYADVQGISLEQDIINNIQSYVNDFDDAGGNAIDANGDGSTTQEAAILTLVQDILNLL